MVGADTPMEDVLGIGAGEGVEASEYVRKSETVRVGVGELEQLRLYFKAYQRLLVYLMWKSKKPKLTFNKEMFDELPSTVYLKTTHTNTEPTEWFFELITEGE